MPRMLPLWAGLLLLTACATPAPKSEPTATSNPCAFLPVPDITQPVREQLAREIDAAPVKAVWPDQMQGYLSLRAAVRACRGGA